MQRRHPRRSPGVRSTRLIRAPGDGQGETMNATLTDLPREHWQQLIDWAGQVCAEGATLTVRGGALHAQGPPALLTPGDPGRPAPLRAGVRPAAAARRHRRRRLARRRHAHLLARPYGYGLCRRRGASVRCADGCPSVDGVESDHSAGTPAAPRVRRGGRNAWRSVDQSVDRAFDAGGTVFQNSGWRVIETRHMKRWSVAARGCGFDESARQDGPDGLDRAELLRATPAADDCSQRMNSGLAHPRWC